MSAPGDPDLLIAARAALLDALVALADQRDALVLIGAQAIYLHTGAAPVALAEATKDSDLAVDLRALDDEPLLDAAMTQLALAPAVRPRQRGEGCAQPSCIGRKVCCGRL